MNIQSATRTHAPQKFLVVSDMGRDQDDEGTMVVMSGLQARDEVKLEGLVANLQPSDMRARLAKGAVQELKIDCPVAVGSPAGHPELKPGAHEFDARYMAGPDSVEADGQALLERKLKESGDHETTLLLISGMTDGYNFIHNHKELCQQKIDRVVMMGGVNTDKDGNVALDAKGFLTPNTANNNTFDKAATAGLFEDLQEMKIPMTVVSNLAAYASAVGKEFFEDMGSTRHPVGERLRDSQRESLEGLWHRANMPADSPGREGLPPRCDRNWFLQTFCPPGTDVPADQPIWGSVSKINLYDAVTLLAATESNQNLFSPTRVTVNGVEEQLIGLSKQNNGVADPAGVAAKLRELSHQGLAAASTHSDYVIGAGHVWEKPAVGDPYRTLD